MDLPDNKLILFVALLFLTVTCQSQEELIEKPAYAPAVIKKNPENIKLITSDIDLFWKMFDRETPLFTKLEVDSQYFDAGTPALSLFYDEIIKSSDAFSQLLSNRFDRSYYKRIRDNTLAIDRRRKSIVNAFKAFKNIYPPAVFTDLTFVIGKLETGGTLLPNGQIVIAAEMFSKPSKNTDLSYLSPWHQSVVRTSDYIPVIALHELVHLQQQRVANRQNATLLDRALLEGSAEFITYLVLNMHLNRALFSYGDAHEKELWDAFTQSMHKTNFSRWLYNGNAGSSNEKPADLGYYIGFKIAEFYYNKASDKKEAVRDIIQMKDGITFLKKSGYADSLH